MERFKNWSKKAFAMVVHPLLRIGLFAKLTDRLAWERKRLLRRETAEKLIGSKHLGTEIQTGPFARMQYPDLWQSCGIEKVVGAYEAELHGVVEELCCRNYTEVINVGCGEGYYAVGFARRLPDASVHAFDTNPSLQTECRRLARANRVDDRLNIGNFCDNRTLNAIPVRKRALVVCDCEGFESELLDQEKSSMLAKADILVETHDFVQRGITSELERRFHDTHDITVFHGAGPDYAKYAALEGLSQPEIDSLLWEARPEPMRWLFMKSKQS